MRGCPIDVFCAVTNALAKFKLWVTQEQLNALVTVLADIVQHNQEVKDGGEV